MKLLITGGCGFIGSAFCRRLIKQHPYLTVVNVDCLYPCSTVAEDLTTSHGNYTFRKADIKNTDELKEILASFSIDTVVHFAAQSHVDTSFTNPMLYTEDNVIGTHSLLEACRAHGKIVRFIHISTDEVYGENIDKVFTENSLLKPTNPYAASKASAEMLVHSYVHSYNLPAIVIRSNNVYGPGQYPEKAVPKFIFQLLDNQKLTLQGSGHQLRSFLYVEDIVDAVLCVLFQGEIGKIYNISSKDEISILELSRRLLEDLKPGEKLEDWIRFVEDRNFNDKRYWIQCEPLKELGWTQRWSLEEGLKKTVEWFRQVDRKTYWTNKVRQVALVWGSKGWIGGQFTEVLLRRGWTVISAASRADDRQAVAAEVSATNPTHLVSLIGRTHGPGFSTIDYLEQAGKLRENMNDNLYGPLVLAGVAKSKGLHMMYMGTGCIFEYDETHVASKTTMTGLGFTEADKPNFFGSSYSTVKGFTDRLMAEEFGSSCLNVRIRMPISSQDGPRNFISKIIAYKKICSIQNSMTVLDDILPLLAHCMEQRTVGTLNAVNPGTIDHNMVLDMYKHLQNSEHTWEEIDNQVLVGTCVKGARSNNYLETTRIEELSRQSLGNLEIPNICESVRKIMEKYTFMGRLL